MVYTTASGCTLHIFALQNVSYSAADIACQLIQQRDPIACQLSLLA